MWQQERLRPGCIKRHPRSYEERAAPLVVKKICCKRKECGSYGKTARFFIQEFRQELLGVLRTKTSLGNQKFVPGLAQGCIRYSAPPVSKTAHFSQVAAHRSSVQSFEESYPGSREGNHRWVALLACASPTAGRECQLLMGSALTDGIPIPLWEFGKK
jgi:hypothetical protein